MVNINFLPIKIIAVKTFTTNDINAIVDYLQFFSIFELDGELFFIA